MLCSTAAMNDFGSADPCLLTIIGEPLDDQMEEPVSVLV